MFTENLAQIWTYSDLSTESRSALPSSPQVPMPTPMVRRPRRHMAALLDGTADALHAAAARMAPTSVRANDLC